MMETSSSTVDITVVLPALNEAENLAKLLPGINENLAGMSYEILLIDDGSDDATAEIAEKNKARVIKHAYRKGNGAAIKRGIREALGQTIVLMDADGQHKPEDLPRLLETSKTCDMVVGARSKGSGQKAHRWAANRLFSLIASYLAGERVVDLTSGFRAIRAEIAKRFVDLLPNTFSYPSTLTVTLARAGYTVVHIPIVTAKREGRSKIRPVSDGLRFLFILLKIGVGLTPLKVFLPLSVMFAMLGIGWYIYTFIEYHRFTNMSALLLCTSVIIGMMGLVAEQIAQLRRERGED